MEKQGRGIRLTAAGQVYARYARTILGTYEQALAAARSQHCSETGMVRIGAATTAGEHILPHLLASFRVAYPRVEIGLEVARRSQVWEMLEHRETDLAVAGRPPRRLPVRTRAVRTNDLVVVGSPAVAEKFVAEEATWLLREDGSGTRAACLELLTTLDRMPGVLTLGSNGAAVAAAVAGLGVTLVSRDAVRVRCAAAELVELPMAGTPMNRPWHVVTHVEISPTTRLMLRHLLADPTDGWQRARISPAGP
ncbi:LysR substrate-binding domain-containing protein [Fodinicola feengrottensis]|uniref:LysR substrate-binding domain-containing protein n=1 Tax=Fodinicola feengrottensis TaxID=435914 RepID=UPI002441CAA2|nr:LysR substrate-binding domain-containing protein [Fodinicola feengrottensis]